MSENDYMGSQAEENAKYLDSIEGKLSQLKNRLQELAAVTIDSEWLKDIIDFGTKAVKLVTSISKQFGGLKTVIAGIGAIFLQKNGLGLINKNQNGGWNFNNLGKGLVGAVKGAITSYSWGDELGKVFDGQALSENLSDYLKNVHPDALTPDFHKWWDDLDTTTQKTVTLGDALQNVGLRTINIGGAFNTLKSIGINAISTLGTMLFAMVASKAISAGLGLLDKYVINKSKYIQEAGDKADSNIEDTKNNYREKEKYIQENADRFAELSQGVSTTGENISLSTEQYQEYLDINKQLANYFPQLITGISDQGTALLGLSGNAKQTVKSLNEVLESERQLQAANIVKELPDSMKASLQDMQKYKEQMDEQQKGIDTAELLKSQTLGEGSISFSYDRYDEIQDEQASWIRWAIQSAQEDSGTQVSVDWDEIAGTYTASWDKDGQKQFQKAFAKRIEETDFGSESQLMGYGQNRQVASNAYKAEWNKQAQNIIAGLDSYDAYRELEKSDLGKKFQDMIAQEIINFDPLSEDVEGFSADTAVQYILDNFVDPVIEASNNPKSKVALGSLINLDTGNMTNEEQRSAIEGFVEQIFPNDKEKQIDLQIALGFVYRDENGNPHEFQTAQRNKIFEQLGGDVDLDDDGTFIRTNAKDVARKQVDETFEQYKNATRENRAELKKEWEAAKQELAESSDISEEEIMKLNQTQQNIIEKGIDNGDFQKANISDYNSLLNWIKQYSSTLKEMEGVGTLADIFAMEDFDVSPFEDKLSAINTALSSLRENGELAADEQLTLQKQIPDLTDFSLESISDKGLNVLDDYINKMREYAETADLGEEGTKQFEKYISNLAAQQASLAPSLDAALNAMREHIVTADPGTALFESQTIQYADYINKLKSEYGDELDMNVIAYMTMEDMFSGSAEEVLQKYNDAKVYVDLELGENNLDKALREQLSGRNNALLSLEESKRQNKTANGQLLVPEDYDRTIVLQSGAVEQAQQAYDQSVSEANTLWEKYKNTDSTLARQKFYTDWLEAQTDTISKEQDLNQKQADLANTRKEQVESEMNPVADSLSKVTEKYNGLNEAMQQIENAHGVIPQEMSDQAEYVQKKIAELNNELGDFYAAQYKETGDVEYSTKSNDYYAQANTATQTAVTDKARTFESTMTQYSDQLTDLQDSASAIQEDITLREGRGLIPTLNQYSKLLHNGEQQLQNLKDQNYELRQQQYEVSGNQEKYREIGDQIRANESAIASMKSNMLGWSDAMKAYAETMGTNLASAIQQAISESMSETGLTSASMKQLQAQFEGLEGFDFSDLYYNTANGVKLDFDAASHYVETQYRQETSILNNQLSRQRSELQSLQAQYNSTTNAAEKLKLATQIDATKSGIDNLYNQLSQYQAQIAATQKQFTQFAEFQRAQETANAGDTYKTIQGYMETQQKAYDLGEVGTDEFKAFTAMGDEWGRVTVEAYEANQAKLKRYLTEDAVGIKNFYDDLVKAGFGTYDDENGYRLDISDYSEAAHALGIGEELMKYTMQRSEDFGFYNDYVENTIDGELKLQETEHDLADAIERKYDLMQKGAPKDVIDEANAEIERLDERTVNLNDKLQDVVADASTITSTQIQSAVDVLGEYKKRLDSAKTDSEKYAWQKEMTQFAEQHHIPLTFDYKVDTDQLDKMYKGWSQTAEKLSLQNRPQISSDIMRQMGYTDVGEGYATVYSHAASNEDETHTVVMTPIFENGDVFEADEFQKYINEVANGAEDEYGLVLRAYDGEDSVKQAQNYSDALHEVQEAWYEGGEIREKLATQLQGYTAEELKNIDYTDGAYDQTNQRAQDAERTVDSLMKELGLSSDMAREFVDVMTDMGLLKFDEKQFNMSLGVDTSQLEGFLSGTRYEGITSFDAMSMSADQLQQKLKELSSKQFVAHVKTEGGEEAYAQLEQIIEATKKQYNIQLGFERMDADPNMSAEEFLGLDRFQQEQYMAHIGVDRTNYDAFIQQVQSHEIRARIQTEIDTKGLEEVQSMTEEDWVMVFDGDTEKAKQAMEEVKSMAEEGEEISMTVKLDQTQFDSLTSSISSQQQGNVIPFDITVNTVQALQSIAAISQAITALRLFALLPVNITVNTETAVSNANALRDAINEIPKNTPVKVNARVYGTGDVYAVRNQINSVNSTSAKVTVSIGSSLYNIRSVANELNSLHDRVITVTTIKTTVNAASGSTGAAGTSNNIRKNTWTRETKATGTLYGVAHASGTAYNTINTKSISAYAGGKRNVALPKDEDALVNELNPESIIFKKVTIISNNYQKIYLIAGKPLEPYLPQHNHEIQINAMV